jgi:proteic killer suppression protein
MIRSFAHDGLRRFFEGGGTSGIPQKLEKRIRNRLEVLDDASTLGHIKVHPWRLHYRKPHGPWSIDVSGPWRILFRWREGEGNAYEVDLRQDH